MDQYQKRLSDAYSDLKDKYTSLKRTISRLHVDLGNAKRENEHLWKKLKQLHEQIGSSEVDFGGDVEKITI